MRLIILTFSLLMTTTVKNVFAEEASLPNLHLQSFDTPTFFTINPEAPKYNFALKKESVPAKQDAVDCQTNKGVDNFGSHFRSFSDTVEDLISPSACMGIKYEAPERFTVNNCKLLTQCSASKTNKDNATFSTFLTLPKMMAEDYVAIKLSEKIKEMEKTEALRKFAEKKYGKDFAPTCKSIFNYEAEKNNKDICDASVMDSGFARTQKKCSVIMNSCYNSGVEGTKEYSAFANNLKVNEGESSLQNFFTAKTDNAVNDSLTSDNEMLEAIASIMSSKEKLNTKVQNIFAKLSDLKKQGKLDPAFTFGTDYISDDSIVYKKSPHYKFFEKILAKPMDMAQARSAIEKYRRDFTKETLTKDCPETPTYSSICGIATEVYKSKRAHVIDRSGTALKLNNENDDDRYEILKGLYPNGIHSKADFGIVMDARRCKAFDFLESKDDVAQQLQDSMNYGASDPFSSGSLLGGIKPGIFYDPQYARYARANNGPNADGVTKTEKPVFTMPDATTAPVKSAAAPASTGSAAGTDKINMTDKDLTNALGAGMKESVAMATAPQIVNSGANNNYVSSNSFNNYAAGSVDAGHSYNTLDSAKGPASTSTSSANAMLTDRITELSKKLSASEDNLARMQEEKTAAEEAKAHQQRVDDENKTIASLKDQINEMKAQTVVKKDDTVLAQASSDSDKADAKASRALSSEGENRESEAYLATPAARAISQEASSQNINRPSGFNSPNEATSSSGTRSANGNGGSASTALSTAASTGTGIILTKLDTVSDDTIKDKILELNNGQKFFIREGDIVQEILPLLKDGKFVLGDDGRPQFLRGQSIKAQDKKAVKADKRKPASVDAADLKRQEEESVRREYERAEYLKLKNITNGIFEKK